MRIDTEKLLACAADTARRTGTHALTNSARRMDVARTMANDVKLKLDIECQALAARRIRATFPGHRFLGEEDDTSTTARQPEFSFAKKACPIDAEASDVLWIVDPIDGTVNFSHGIPLWCCSVAVAVRNEIVAGAVYAPALDRCYTARAGGKATCNGRPIRVSGRKKLSDSVLATSMDRTLHPGVPPFSLFHSVAPKVQRARILGSAALDLCFVAEGSEDGYMEGTIYIWDIAAGGLIVQQAGGRIEQLARFPGNRICCLATNGLIHDRMKAALRPALRALSR